MNDAFFYRAMALRLYREPIELSQEWAMVSQGILPLETAETFFETGFHSNYLHIENGLSHQPPYVYRILAPTVIGFAHRLGIPILASEAALYLVGLLLLSVFSFLIFSGARKTKASLLPAAASLALSFSAVSVTSSVYPDMLYLGLATTAAWAILNGKAVSFATVAALATMTRETGILLGFAWLVASFLEPDRLNPKRVAVALAPIAGFAVARWIPSVPNTEIDLWPMVQTLATDQALAYGLVSLVLINLASPAIASIWTTHERFCRERVLDSLLLVGTSFYVLTSMLVAVNQTRMAFLVLPILLSSQAWQHVSVAWAPVTIAVGVSFGLAETLSGRAEPLVGQWSWLVALVITAIIAISQTHRLRSRG